MPLSGRVVLVEDDPMVGSYLKERLLSWGLWVEHFRDPLEALSCLETPGFEVDLLLSDQSMPSLTGLELVRRCRESRPELPAVLVSANTDDIEPDAPGEPETPQHPQGGPPTQPRMLGTQRRPISHTDSHSPGSVPDCNG